MPRDRPERERNCPIVVGVKRPRLREQALLERAIGHRFVPMIVALISMAVNAGLNSVFVFVFKWDHTWLAFTTAVVACANCTSLYVMLTRIAGGLEGRRLMQTLGRLAGPVIALGLVSWLGWHFVMEPRWAGFGFLNRSFTLGLTIMAAGTAYMLLAHLLKVDEARQFMNIASRRLRTPDRRL